MTPRRPTIFPAQQLDSMKALPHSLVRIPDRDELEFAALCAGIEFRAGAITGLEAEIQPLVAALEKFEWEYKARLGHLQSELRSIGELVATLEDRTVRIHARMVADPNGILGDLFDREELREIGEMFGIEIPPTWFRAADHDERRERESAWRFFGDGHRGDLILRKRRRSGGYGGGGSRVFQRRGRRNFARCIDRWRAGFIPTWATASTTGCGGRR